MCTPALSLNWAQRKIPGSQLCLKENFPTQFKKVRFPESTSYGIKPISSEGSRRLVISAIRYALKNSRKSVTLMHKGNIMKFTEGWISEMGLCRGGRRIRGKGIHPAGMGEDQSRTG